jgi:hypothetical protein
MEVRSQEPEWIRAALVIASRLDLDVQILASCFRLLAPNENKIPITLRITVPYDVPVREIRAAGAIYMSLFLLSSLPHPEP